MNQIKDNNQIFSKKLRKASYEDDQFILDEGLFHDVLIIERKLAERSKKPFMLLLLDIHYIMCQGINLTIIKKLRKVFILSNNEINLKGWYNHGNVLGIIYREITTNNKELVLKKIRENMIKEFSEEIADKAKITCILFPQNYNNQLDKQEIKYFYPELLDKITISTSSIIIKRIIDLLGSLIAFIFFSPFFILIPILIKSTTRGPIFFKQKRIGLGGKTFTLYKFRSMYVDNDQSTHKEFVKKFIKDSGKPYNNFSVASNNKIFKIINDPRITPIGKLLRKTSLDELPQFFNVLIGNMSLVGPRPAIPYEIQEYSYWHLYRIFPVKPGITGIWQVEGRSQISFENMVRMDIKYIQSWSPLLDLKIIFKTPFSVFTFKGAH